MAYTFSGMIPGRWFIMDWAGNRMNEGDFTTHGLVIGHFLQSVYLHVCRNKTQG